MRNYATYIMASARNGTLYTGMTSDLAQRVWQHKHDVFPGFSRQYGCKMLAWYEVHDDVETAIQREKRIKRWRRNWKLQLIEGVNPDWVCLYANLMAVPEEAIVQKVSPAAGSRINPMDFPG